MVHLQQNVYLAYADLKLFYALCQFGRIARIIARLHCEFEGHTPSLYIETSIQSIQELTMMNWRLLSSGSRGSRKKSNLDGI